MLVAEDHVTLRANPYPFTAAKAVATEPARRQRILHACKREVCPEGDRQAGHAAELDHRGQVGADASGVLVADARQPEL